MNINDLTQEKAKKNYDQTIRLSQKILHQISCLRVDNPFLNRPFLFDGKNL